MKTRERRIAELKKMNENIINLGDEMIWWDWIGFAVPDKPSEEDYEFIADDIEEYMSVVRYYEKLMEIGEEQ